MSKTGRTVLVAVIVVAVAAIGWFEVRWVTTSDRPGEARQASRQVAVDSGGTVSAYPLPGTPTASQQTTISFRGLPDRRGRGPTGISVIGEVSGRHPGGLTRHSDGHGFSFDPRQPFRPGERVTVRTDFDLRGGRGGDFHFTIAQPPASAVETEESGAAREADLKESKNSSATAGFESRPQLHPPKMKVRKDERGNSGKYTFLAPKLPFSRDTQEGPLIVDGSGDVVWFQPLDNGLEATDFKVQRYRGEKVLTWWEGRVQGGHGQGEFVITDHNYQEIARVQAGNGYRADLHEAKITPRGTVLLLAYNTVRWSGSDQGAESRRVVDCVVQEVDIATGAVLFEWHSLGHIGLDESYREVPKDTQAPYDYVHLNSISVDKDGNLLISGRHTQSVLKVNRKTGAVRWRLGGKQSDFTMTDEARFYYQHDAQRLPGGALSVFDNGSSVPDGEPPRKQPRGIVLKLDMESMKASVLREYEPTGNLRSFSQGNMQTLPNGNVFIGWGNEPAYTLYEKDGTVVRDVRIRSRSYFLEEIDTSMQRHSYRAYRFSWEGRPKSDPAIDAESTGDDKLRVRASWNGATEVEKWQLLAGQSKGKLHPVTKVTRDGFETRITARVQASHVAVSALGEDGEKLARSATVELDDSSKQKNSKGNKKKD